MGSNLADGLEFAKPCSRGHIDPLAPLNLGDLMKSWDLVGFFYLDADYIQQSIIILFLY